MTKPTQLLMIASLLTGLCACDPAPAGGGADAGSPGAADVAVDSGVSPQLAQFLGSWSYVSGSYTVTCGTEPAISEPASGSVSFFLDETGQLVASDGQGCEVPCTVSGDTAVGLAGTACPSEGAVSTSLVYTIVNGGLREQGSGLVTSDGGSCTLTDDATLSRG